MESNFVDSVLSDQCKSQDDELYALLGCPKTATIAQIMAEYRARVRDCHPDTAEGDLNEANEHFLRLQQAKEILTDEPKKRIYDDWLNSSISVPWKLWMENSELRMSMHWAAPASCTQMITGEKSVDGEKKVQQEDRDVCWRFSCKDSDVIRMFRNYQI
ncbi:J domain-containing protein [Toxocara canis]|uniref:J domain-containing protein n=1 Tax=Toxocara canis TaxID=6265 RepID=A0A0B2VT89_TOXCA|nr:J domain-containing protein [Toxocara canis]